MAHRTIAKISTCVTMRSAVEFVENYNRHARGCHSARLELKGDDGPAVVLMLEHDTEAEAITARSEASSCQLCEWCAERLATLADGLCERCWDERELEKAELEKETP